MDHEKLRLKQLLLSECLRLQKAIVDNARQAMLEAQQSASDNDDDTEEKLYNSYREEMQNKRDLFARQYDQALDDLALLQKVTPTHPQEDVGFGAVVKTDAGQKLFVSISLGQVHVEGEDFFAISPSAPLFKAIAGRRPGDDYQFRDRRHRIVEVF